MADQAYGATIDILNVYPHWYKFHYYDSDVQGTRMLLSSVVNGVVRVGDEIVLRNNTRLVIERIKCDRELSEKDHKKAYIDYYMDVDQVESDFARLYVKKTGGRIRKCKGVRIISNHLSAEEVDRKRETTKYHGPNACERCGWEMMVLYGYNKCPNCGKKVSALKPAKEERKTTIEVYNAFPTRYRFQRLPSAIDGMRQLSSRINGVIHVGDEIVLGSRKRLVIERIRDAHTNKEMAYAANDFADIFVKDSGPKAHKGTTYQVIRNQLSEEELEIKRGATKQKELDKNRTAITCKSCGGAMKLNQYANRYECPFCGTTAPITDGGHAEYETDSALLYQESRTTIDIITVFPTRRKGKVLPSEIEGTLQLYSEVNGVVYVGDEIVLDDKTHLVIERIRDPETGKELDYVESDVNDLDSGRADIFVKDTGIKVGKRRGVPIIKGRPPEEKNEAKAAGAAAPKKAGRRRKEKNKLLEIKHVAYQRADGLISIQHLNESTLKPPQDEDELSAFSDSISNEMSIRDWFERYDGVDHFSEELRISVVCPACGAEVTGREHQNTFACAYCGNSIIVKDSIKAGTYKKRNIIGQIAKKNVPKQALPFVVSEEQALSYALEFIRSHDELKDIEGLEDHVREWLLPFFLPASVFDASFMWETKGLFGKTMYYEEIRNCICPETAFLYKYQIDRLEPWNFDKVAPFDPALMDENAYIIAPDWESGLVYAPALVDNRIRTEHQRITGNASVKMRTAKRHFDEQSNGVLLLPIYNTELYALKGALMDLYVSVAVNGQTGKVVVQVKNELDIGACPVQYESEPRRWEGEPKEYTRREGPYQVQRTGDKDTVKIVNP